MPAGFYDSRFLNSVRIQRIIEIAGSYLERNRPLTFLNRLEQVPASDDELMGRFTAKVLAADLIADDQKAVVTEAGQLEIITTTLPNVKVGLNLTQKYLDLLNRLTTGAARVTEEDAALDYEQRLGENLLQGVRERLNMLAAAMMLDTATYNRLGVQFSASWGMPANLKVTATPLWSLDGGTTGSAAATPVTNIFAMDVVDANNYGLGPFNRITMSGQAFDFMTGTTEFANKAGKALGVAFLPTPGAIEQYNRPEMIQLASRLFNKEIIIDEKTYREQAAAGTTATSRVLPLNKVLLDRSSNSTREWDIGNAVVTESLVAELTGSAMLSTNPRMVSGGGTRGPLAYYTPANSDLNPPQINAWAVQRAFPRRHVIECSAVLTVW